MLGVIFYFRSTFRQQNLDLLLGRWKWWFLTTLPIHLPSQTQSTFSDRWCLHPQAFCPAGNKGQEGRSFAKELSLDERYLEVVSDV